jgi:hypothetical protein
MLTIKEKQREVFQKAQLLNFIERMLAHLKNVFPDDIEESDQVLKMKISDWIDDAESYDINYEDQVERYIELCYCSEELAENPKPSWVEYVLLSPELTRNEVLDFLEYKLVYEAAERESESLQVTEITETTV